MGIVSKYLHIFIAIVILAVSVTLVSAGPAFAQDPLDQSCQGELASSDVCRGRNPNVNPISGDGIVQRIANILSIVAGIAAVIVIIIGGLRMVLSGGDANKVKSGRDTLIYASVGLIVILMARSLVIFIVNAAS